MKITRKEFLSVAAGAAAFAAIPSSGLIAASCAQPASTNRPKRGVSIYTYSGVLYWQMTLEDCFKEMYDMNATGLEMLTSHIEGYPNPTDEWIENFKAMCAKYNIVPVEYGHWVDSRRHIGRELTTQESYDMLVRDIKLANKLGFTVGRTKLGVIDRPGIPEMETLTPVRNWQEFIKMALPVAEENNFRMCPEIHMPTLLKSKMVDDYVEFIEQNNTKWFGLNIDFGVFAPRNYEIPGIPNEVSQPEDIIPLLPYTYACHAKFNDMSEDCIETNTPYDRILQIMVEHKWDGYLLSEYEGQNKSEPGYASEQLRRQHVMMKRLLGEV